MAKAVDKPYNEQLKEDEELLTKAAAGDAKSALKSLLMPMGVALGSSAIAGTYGYLKGKSRQEEHLKTLRDSYTSLVGTHKEFFKEPEKFRQRFTELSLISPTLASNPRMAHKVISPRLDKGFDLDDVHRLSAIEYHTAHSPKPASPWSSAEASALGAFDKVVNFTLPAFLAGSASRAAVDKTEDKLRAVNKEISGIRKNREELLKGGPATQSDVDALKKRVMERMRAGGGQMPKTSSQMLVSEECLGRMLADRYCMYKTAAPSGGFFRKGIDALKSYAGVMGPALAIGGGVQLVSSLLKQKEVERLHQEAEKIYSGIKSTSEYAKEDPHLAREAFDTLKAFAPSLAVRPAVARTFVEGIVKAQGQMPWDTVNSLARTEQAIQQLNEASGGGFLEGLKKPMSLFSYSVAGSSKEDGGDGSAKVLKQIKSLKAQLVKKKTES